MLSSCLDIEMREVGKMAELRTFATVDELRAAVGEQLGYSDWVEIEQKRIDLFAEADRKSTRLNSSHRP